jgi:hypothetical protein
LTPLAVSPPLLHAIMVLDRRYAPAIRPDVMRALLMLHDTPRGQQVMSVFGIERLTEGSPADLAPAMDLLARLERARVPGKGR